MTKRLAVLVDGDNINGLHADEIRQTSLAHGTPDIIRVYLDAQRPSNWHGAEGFRLIHAGTGKNASDVLMAIDAMELALSSRLDAVVLVSSDGDFTHLAQRLREHGFPVIGMGEAKAPRPFRAACTTFIDIGQTSAKPNTARPTAGSAPASPATGTPKHRPASDLDRKIRAMIATHSTNGAGMRLNEMAPRMHKSHRVQISTHPERTWRAYLTARPHLFSLDPKGPKAMVRFKSDGFRDGA